ncbi:MAG: dimethyl sulfoxide reductase anchor subunit family protein [Thiotrichaceae bacterium]|uniref:Dimethyl sulfoxide reductase anchor subunit n=1 Tax=Candidatus Thiocaldithrix dubininis TaxID=3080823 RepID=A0AA95KHW0_9GAMM|nr:MAG: dimethyl sulfoxide reductase anchor subunit [Candidatus Thiocaldithrix dubininis]
MHPAFSVIFFTVSSGAGYGLFMLIALANALGLVKMDVSTVIIGGILALVLITAGLLSSTLHLANPKNAWRAVMRFKTSWLSREGVFAILFYPVALLYLLGVYITQNQGNALVTFLGLAVVVLALATVFSTGMIYGCLKTIRQWNTALTPANYILLGLASGSVLLSFLLAAAGASAAPMAGVAAGLLLIAAITKAIYYFWVKQVTGPTINTATGFTRAKVRLFDTGNTAGTFLTDEFGYQADATFLRNLKGAVFGLAFIVPLFLMLLMANGHLGWMGAFLAVLSVLAGLGVERWLFFAEARHVVRLYHGAQHT